MSIRRSAFTLIELLVVISIIAVLAGLLLPVINSVQTAGRKVQSLSNMRQLGTAFALYCGQNDGKLPQEGEKNPTWSSSVPNTDANNTAWYNALPRLGNFPAVSDFAIQKADFYTKKNLLYVPGATYPSTKVSGPGPLFAVAFCSKFFSGGIDPTIVRLQSMQQPSHTVVFQESGLPGEKKIVSAQSTYNGQTSSFASRSIARYSGRSVLVFADGHAEAMAPADFMDLKTGTAYFPQTLGKVYWTMSPDTDPR